MSQNVIKATISYTARIDRHYSVCCSLFQLKFLSQVFILFSLCLLGFAFSWALIVLFHIWALFMCILKTESSKAPFTAARNPLITINNCEKMLLFYGIWCDKCLKMWLSEDWACFSSFFSALESLGFLFRWRAQIWKQKPDKKRTQIDDSDIFVGQQSEGTLAH